jgi:uncharacterized membrane protein YgdD (TMEM256/DUF423 family)
MKPNFLAFGAWVMFVGVLLGAFGAHALHLDPARHTIYETGVIYHLAHALAILLVGVLDIIWPVAKWKVPGWLFAVGILLFSGSLYALAATGTVLWGAVTPLGGLCFLAGWLSFAITAVKARKA